MTDRQILIFFSQAASVEEADCLRLVPLAHRGQDEIVPFVKRVEFEPISYTFNYQRDTYVVSRPSPVTFTCPLVTCIWRFKLTPYQRLKTLSEFRTMPVAPYPSLCLRDSEWIVIQTDELLPGDVISVG